jgi:glycosyltransferase involved in cell wall biosynthesis
MSSLYALIPAYNEAANIKSVVREWYEVVEKIGQGSKLVIFDGGSPDGTGAIVEEMRKTLPALELVTCPKCGHGPTLQIAYRYALERNADFIFQTDADGQTIASEFSQFWEMKDRYDVQIGFRKIRQDGISRWFVTRTLRLILFFVFGLWIPDANTPFRLMSQASLERHLPRIPEAHKLTNVLLTVSFVKAKERIRFAPITFRPRQGGENTINITQIIKTGWQSIGDFIGIQLKGLRPK